MFLRIKKSKLYSKLVSEIQRVSFNHSVFRLLESCGEDSSDHIVIYSSALLLLRLRILFGSVSLLERGIWQFGLKISQIKAERQTD